MQIQIDPATHPQAVEEKRPLETGDTVMAGMPMEQEKKIICDMYDLDEVEAKRSDYKIQALIDYVKAHNKELSPDNIRWTLRSLELKLGTPPIAEKRIDYMARYAYLMSEKKAIDKELEKFY